MGITWTTEVISFAVGGSAYIWIPSDVLNILTAVFVFFIFVYKPNIWILLKKRYKCHYQHVEITQDQEDDSSFI
jgi:hypothetical protein